MTQGDFVPDFDWTKSIRDLLKHRLSKLWSIKLLLGFHVCESFPFLGSSAWPA
jgi:hypothetical protein